MRAVVIGAGIGGLAIAVRLASRRVDVTVCERCDQPGGRARVERLSGFVFDRGPSVLTGRRLLDELWALAGEAREDHVTLLPVQPDFNFVYDDGTTLGIWPDAERMRAEVARVAPSDLAGWDRYRGHAVGFWENSVRPLMDKPMMSLWSLAPHAPGMVANRAYLSMDALVRRFVKTPVMIRALRFNPTFVGLSPWAPGSAIYSGMQGLEWGEGVSFPQGGMNVLVAQMEALARRKGARFRYGAEVASLRVHGGRRTTGVILRSGEFLPADVVISNADVASTYERLVPRSFGRRRADDRMKRARYAPGLFVWYFGTRRTYPGVAHHTVKLAQDLPGGFALEGPDRFDTFTYLHRPTATDPSLAPPGCDTFYALRMVPNLKGIADWGAEGVAQRDILLNDLSRTLLPGLQNEIVVQRWMTPRDLSTELDTVWGAGFGLAPTLTQQACFRPPARSSQIDNLYMVGEGTHPGPGIPAVLSSAAIVDSLLGTETGGSK